MGPRERWVAQGADSGRSQGEGAGCASRVASRLAGGRSGSILARFRIEPNRDNPTRCASRLCREALGNGEQSLIGIE